ncbi:MAG: class I SAM-dependent methyltransferase [Candidatus Methanomethylophilaceae archaeon]
MTGNYDDSNGNQSSNPHGDEGFRAVREMNENHLPQIEWGLRNLPDIRPDRILDIGCGGGVFTRLILERYPGAKGDAIDISPVSVEYACEFNKEFIDAGRLKIVEGNVICMPYPDGGFDLVVSNASHFFWPDLPQSLKEVSRTISAGGILCLTAGMHVDEDRYEKMKDFKRPGFNFFKDSDLLEMMEDAGLTSECFVDPEKEFGCYIGRKRSE